MDNNSIEKEHVQSLFVLSYLLIRMGKFDMAETIFQALLELNLNNSDKLQVYKNLAYINVQTKNYSKALEYLREVAIDGKIKTKDSVLYLIKAEALFQSNRLDEAKNALQAYHSLVGNI